jgi:hypothetical protein
MGMTDNIFFRKDVRLWVAVFFAFVAVLFLFFIFYSSKKTYHRNLDYEFDGKVESVFYDVKGTPTIMINKKEYFLTFYDWDIDHQIEKGDSLEKRKGTMLIKLIKFDSKKTIYFGK